MSSFSDMNEILDKWESLSKSFGVAPNDYERLIRHYYGFKISNGLNAGYFGIAATVIIPFMLFRLKRHKVSYENSYEAIVTASNKDYLLNKTTMPQELLERYTTYKFIPSEPGSLMRGYRGYTFDSSSYKIAIEVLNRYPAHPLMGLWVILQLGRVTALIKKYNPKAVIVTQAEEDFTSSIVTRYCEEIGVKYICVQHGEYCYNPSMAYMRFSEYYAWDEHTIKNLELTNDKINFAHLYKPNRYTERYKRKEKPSYFISYYLSGEKEDEVRRIKDVLCKFTESGYKCKIRRHPRAMKKEVIESIFSETDVFVEECSEVSIEESLCEAEYIVSYRSTVLSEAFYNSMNIVIDDIVGDIDLLIRVHDVNVERAPLRLSDLMRKCLG